MRISVISDNHDTLVGMRLAGISGVVTHDREGVLQALAAAKDDEEMGLVLITEQLVQIAGDVVDDLKQHAVRPLILEIPDRHGNGRAGDSITRYIREAIGLKI